MVITNILKNPAACPSLPKKGICDNAGFSLVYSAVSTRIACLNQNEEEATSQFN